MGTGAELYLQANKRSKIGAPVVLHPCPREDDLPNCQWNIEGYPLPGTIPSDDANGKVIEELNRQKWLRKKTEIRKTRAEMRATLAQNIADQGVTQLQVANLKLEQLQQRLEDAQ